MDAHRTELTTRGGVRVTRTATPFDPVELHRIATIVDERRGGVMSSGIRQALAAAAMSRALVRRSRRDALSAAAVPPDRKASTSCRTEAWPSSPPWKPSTKSTLRGHGQSGKVTASASGITASQGRDCWRVTCSK